MFNYINESLSIDELLFNYIFDFVDTSVLKENIKLKNIKNIKILNENLKIFNDGKILHPK